MVNIKEISEFLQKGRAKNVKVLVTEALEEGQDPKEIILEPKLIEIGNEPVGKAVVGTVKGDLHDIGKNLVTMMLKGAGFEIYDLGVDVEPATFVDKAEETGADIIGMSALLTTTMPNMGQVVEELKNRGLREKYIVMVGGAPVTEEFAQQIGADYYTQDAATCAEIAKKAVEEKA